MSTLNGPVWSRCSIAPTNPFRLHFPAHTEQEKLEARIRMNVAAHQEKEKNESTSKREAGEERKQATNFNQSAWCSFAVIQGIARLKMVCVRGVPGVTWTLGKANSHFSPTQMGSGTAPPC